MAGSEQEKPGGDSFAALFERTDGAQRTRGGPRKYRTGDRVEVTVVAIGRDSVFADLGAKQEGFFERIELETEKGELRAEVGSTISAQVVDVDSTTGQVRLSPIFVRQKPGAEIDYSNISSDDVRIPITKSGPLIVEGARVRGVVTGIERYGLFVQISGTQGRGGRGLVPISETATPRNADLRKLFPVGQEIDAKVMQIDEQGRVRLSIKALEADDELRTYNSYLEGQSGEPGATEGDEAGGAAAAATTAKKKGAPGKKAKPEPRNFGTLGDLLKSRR